MRVISGPSYKFNHPRALALRGPDLFVANEGDGVGGSSVTELNASTGALVRVISGPRYNFFGPSALALRGPDLFVANYYGGQVTELNASTGTLVRVISGAAYKFYEPVALVLRGPDLFVADMVSSRSGGGGSVTEVNASTGALVRVISGAAYKFDNPRALVLRGPDLFVANMFGSSVTELNVSPAATRRQPPATSPPTTASTPAAPPPRGRFLPSKTWRWQMEKTGGYKMGGTLQVQAPVPLSAAPLLPGFSSTSAVATDCPAFNSYTDAVLPAELTLVNETTGFPTTVSATFNLYGGFPTFDFVNLTPTVSLSVDSSYSSGDSCTRVGFPNPGPAWGVQCSGLAPGALCTTSAYIVISGYYIPDHPTGNTQLLDDSILMMQDLPAQAGEAGQWDLTQLTGPGIPVPNNPSLGPANESIPLSGKSIPS